MKNSIEFFEILESVDALEIAEKILAECGQHSNEINLSFDELKTLLKTEEFDSQDLSVL